MRKKEEAVLHAATKLFSEHGYHAVGVDRIISESNVAKMTFYKYFPSKITLIERVLIRRDKILRENILEEISRYRSPTKKLKAIFDWYGNWFCDPDFHGCMFIKASEEFSTDGDAMRVVSQGYREWLQNVIVGILRDIGVGRPEALALYLVLIIDGLTVNSNMFRSGVDEKLGITWSYVKQLLKN
ncbi:MAG: TetR/AcrR family transcriptional regulator [Pseudomonadales bacterium]|nr:TetR/AcrR family transcriptional regulator [Pseudomonadales bacterium]